jgi:hypothetical protein
MDASDLPKQVGPFPAADADDLPTYTESDEGLPSTIQQLLTLSGNVNLPITSCQPSLHHGFGVPYELTRIQQDVVRSFFAAISTKKDEVVAMMIENNLVTANTTDRFGQTPLLAAVAAGNVRMVQELVDFGAEVDGFGVHGGTERTPLQLAASMGNLILVKLFIEVYHANDALIAPDGQLALRLAVANGHREVADFLPLRRGGEWRRWEIHHAKAIERTKKALKRIYRVFKFLAWDIPKFFLWLLPKEVVVMPTKKAMVWAWKHRGRFGPWCKRQAQETPARIQKMSRWALEKTRAIPKAATKTAKETWAFCTQTLPRWLKKFWRYLLSFLTKKIPAAFKIIVQWLWAGLKTIGHSIFSVLGRALSLLHTLISSVISFFRALTLKDIWNGFCDLLRTIFVDVPVKICSWASKFFEVSYEVMGTLFGLTGKILASIGLALLYVATYIPTKILIIVTSLGGSVGKAWEELLVWINPKR